MESVGRVLEHWEGVIRCSQVVGWFGRRRRGCWKGGVLGGRGRVPLGHMKVWSAKDDRGGHGWMLGGRILGPGAVRQDESVVRCWESF